MQKSGYIPEPLHFADYSHEKAYGGAPIQAIVPLNRDVSGVPVVYQGDEPACVSCTASWIKSYMEQTHPALSWEWLANTAGTASNGVTPSKVFGIARKQGIAEDFQGKNADAHKIGNYFYVRLDKQSIYHALTNGVLALGLKDWQGVGPHMVVAYDVCSDGWKCLSWWKQNEPDYITVPFDYVDDCISFGEKQDGENIRFPFMEVLADKFSMVSTLKKIIVGVVAALLAVFGSIAGTQYGAAGIPGEYSSQIATAITSSDTSIPVISRTLFTGETFDDASLFHPIYIAVGKGSTREYDACTFFNTTGTYPTFYNCTRGISALATSTDITVISGAAYAHTAGESVTITNQPGFFRNLVDIFSAQSVAGIKTIADAWVFNSFPHVSSSSALPTANGMFATKLYVDNVGAGGFTASNVSTTLGLQAISSGVPNCPSGAACVGVNASSTGGIGFYQPGGALLVNVSSTASTNGGFIKYTFNALNQIYWDIASFVASNITWTGTQIFSGAVTSTLSLQVPSPTSTMDATPKGYVDNSIVFFQATGTANMSITAGQALFISATSSQILPTNSSTATSTYQFIGIAVNSVAAGATVTYTRAGGVNCQQSGLVAGTWYYMNGTLGQIATTPGTYQGKIGQALSPACIQVTSPKFTATGIYNLGIAAAGASTTYIGFYPAHIEITGGCGSNGTNSGFGFSVGDESNFSVNYGYNATNQVGGADANNAIHIYCNHISPFQATISRNQQGFTTTLVTNANLFQPYLHYVASNE